MCDGMNVEEKEFHLVRWCLRKKHPVDTLSKCYSLPAQNTYVMTVLVNNRPLVRVFHQGCERNLPDDKREKPKKRKIQKSEKFNIGTWNVRTLNGDFKLENLCQEMERMKIDILGVAETHWNTESASTFEEYGYMVIQSSRKDKIHRQGVAVILNKKAASYLSDYRLYSERLMSISLEIGSTHLKIFQVYAPDSTYQESEITAFLQSQLNLTRRSDDIMLMGDFNGKLGSDASLHWPDVAGKFIPGQGNENGERFLQFCALHNLSIMNTMYRHKSSRLVTWIPPDGRTKKNIKIE